MSNHLPLYCCCWHSFQLAYATPTVPMARRRALTMDSAVVSEATRGLGVMTVCMGISTTDQEVVLLVRSVPTSTLRNKIINSNVCLLVRLG